MYMKKSIYFDKVVLDLSAPGQIAPGLLRELAFYGKLLELSIHDSEESCLQVEMETANISDEYLTKDTDDRFTSMLENKLNKNYPAKY